MASSPTPHDKNVKQSAIATPYSMLSPNSLLEKLAAVASKAQKSPVGPSRMNFDESTYLHRVRSPVSEPRIIVPRVDTGAPRLSLPSDKFKSPIKSRMSREIESASTGTPRSTAALQAILHLSQLDDKTDSNTIHPKIRSFASRAARRVRSDSEANLEHVAQLMRSMKRNVDGDRLKQLLPPKKRKYPQKSSRSQSRRKRANRSDGRGTDAECEESESDDADALTDEQIRDILAVPELKAFLESVGDQFALKSDDVKIIHQAFFAGLRSPINASVETEKPLAKLETTPDATSASATVMTASMLPSSSPPRSTMTDTATLPLVFPTTTPPPPAYGTTRSVKLQQHASPASITAIIPDVTERLTSARNLAMAFGTHAQRSTLRVHTKGSAVDDGVSAKSSSRLKLDRGTAVQVHWPRDGSWHCGSVINHEPKTGNPVVLYSCGLVEMLDPEITPTDIRVHILNNDGDSLSGASSKDVALLATGTVEVATLEKSENGATTKVDGTPSKGRTSPKRSSQISKPDTPRTLALLKKVRSRLAAVWDTHYDRDKLELRSQIRNILEDMGISQRILSRHVGCAQSTFSLWLCSRNCGSHNYVEKKLGKWLMSGFVKGVAAAKTGSATA